MHFLGLGYRVWGVVFLRHREERGDPGSHFIVEAALHSWAMGNRQWEQPRRGNEHLHVIASASVAIQRRFRGNVEVHFLVLGMGCSIYHCTLGERREQTGYIAADEKGARKRMEYYKKLSFPRSQ